MGGSPNVLNLDGTILILSRISASLNPIDNLSLELSVKVLRDMRNKV
jgi:hypothetical protein